MHIIISLIIFFMAIVVHEYSHGWVAYKLGDPSAKYSGRLTLNPLAHIDPFGTIILPILLILADLPVFGWAKPVPVNFWSLHNPKRDMIWVGLAGPIANIILALILTIFLKFASVIMSPSFINLLTSAIIINLVLAVFNLIPLPPLDGSRVLIGLLPSSMAIQYSMLEPFGFIIIFFLLSLGLFSKIVFPIVKFLANLLKVY